MADTKSWMTSDHVDFLHAAEDQASTIANESASKYVGEVNEILDLSNGESSCVFKVEGEKGSCILKFGRFPEVLAGEVEALKSWKELGIKVPEIYEVNIENNPPYAIMEFVEFERFSEVELSPEEFNGALYDLGVQMAKMHSIEVEPPADLSIDLDKLTQRKVAELKQLNIWDAELARSLNGAINRLVESKDSLLYTIIHDDLLPYNCFYDPDTKEITIFDPIATQSPAVLDIGRTYFKLYTSYGETAANTFLNGYLTIREIDKELIRSGVIIKGIMQMATSAKKGRMHIVEAGRQLILSHEF